MTRLLILTLLLGTPSVASAQPPTKKPDVSPAKKPEATAAAEFKPNQLAKLAIIVSKGDKEVGLMAASASDQVRLVEDVFLETLVAKGHSIAARSDIVSVLREKKFQESGATDDLAKSVGKVLNVPAVLMVRITEVSAEVVGAASVGRAAVSARLVNVETGAILWSGTHSGKAQLASRSATGPVLVTTAAGLAEAFPGKSSVTANEVSPKSLPKLAVITVGGQAQRGFGPQAKDAPQSDRQREVEEMFVQALIQKGYELASRSDIQSVAKEQQFQKSGLTEDNAVAAGKLLNVTAVLLVGITDFATEPTGVGGRAKATRVAVGARLVDVASGKVLWSHVEYQIKEVKLAGDANDLLGAVAKDVTLFLPPNPTTPRELLNRAERLEVLGQTSASVYWYKLLVVDHAGKPEGKKAVARLKTLGDR